MSFIDELQKSTNKTARTANGAISNKSTLDPLLDFFSKAGAMRNDIPGAIKLFKKAYAADPTMAVRCLFYLRDIRGGQGERAVFRSILATLSNETIAKVVQFIPEFGRWDEVPINQDTAPGLLKQLIVDEENMKANKPVSLLAKWLPSENASSKITRDKAENLCSYWGIKPRQYRKRVSALRKYIKILEQQMSSKEWAEIQYDKIPSQAHRKHVKAFKRNDGTRYETYLGQVEKGEKKINSNTAFTYEIYDMVSGWGVSSTAVRAADAMWKALPDYTQGQNALVLADVSGSMAGRPMSISTSLALYFAERNEGPFKGKYMTFTDFPHIVEVNGGTIKDKLDFIEGTDVGYSTNLERAFDAILNAAKASNATQEDLPQTLYIISDMQFNDQMSGNNETNFESAERKFRESGYQLPHVVFWNCAAWGNDAPATKFDNRVTLISGASQSTFQYVLAGKTPIQSMMDILNSERYAKIII